jgi:hypothetical protein
MTEYFGFVGSVSPLGDEITAVFRQLTTVSRTDNVDNGES